MEENKDFFRWYKKRITDNQEEPPADAWQNISEALDINDVWRKVSAQLDNDGGWFSQRPLYYAAPLVLLLLMSGGLFYYYQTDTLPVAGSSLAVTADNVQSKTNESQPDATTDPSAEVPFQPAPASPDATTNKVSPEAETTTSPAPGSHRVTDDVATRQSTKENAGIKGSQIRKSLALSDTHDDEKMVESLSNTIRQDDETATPAANATQANTAITKSAFPVGDEQTSEQPGFETIVHNESDTNALDAEMSGNITGANNGKIRAIRATVSSLELADSMLMVDDVHVLLLPVSIDLINMETAPARILFDKTLEFGITASIKNTWLINRETMLGLEKHTLNTTIPDFGKDIGLLVAYNFSPRWSVQTEGMFISESGQRYKEYRNGKYVTREVDLNYYGLNLMVRYNRYNMVYGERQNGHSIISGVFAGVLNNAKDRINHKTLDSRALYRDHNYGIILGYEYNRYIFSNLVVTSGLRVNYGFPNIDTGLFYRTFTGSLDFNVALKYRVGL